MVLVEAATGPLLEDRGAEKEARERENKAEVKVSEVGVRRNEGSGMSRGQRQRREEYNQEMEHL